MFSFRKKDKEKEKEKKKEKEKEKEKKKNDKEKKSKDRPSMTQDELNKLDEVKKGLFRRHSEKESIGSSGSSKLFRKSGSYMPKTESTNEGFMCGGSASQVQIVASLKPEKNSRVTLKKINSLPGRREPPLIQPKPKSILKGSSNYGPGLPNQGVTGNIDDSSTLQRNTLLNEIQQNFVDKSADSSKELTPADSPQKPAMGLQDKPIIIVNDEKVAPLSPAEKTFDFDLHLPSIVPPKPGRIRELFLKRQPGGDFGFSLRKGVVMERHNMDIIGSKRTVIFAEPGTGPKATETGLLPGDRLVEVNGTNVENSKREEIIEMIRGSADSVVLKVQPVPDLMELSVRTAVDGGKVDLQDDVAKGGTLKRSGSVRYKKMLQFHLDDSHNMEDSEDPLSDIAVIRRSPCGRRHLATRSQCYSGEEEQFYSAALAQTRYPMPLYSTLEHVRNYKLPTPAYWTKSEDDVKSEKAWLESDKVWLIHKGGFSSATLLKTNGMSPLPEGKVKVKVDHGGEIIEVEDEDIEKANPPQFDKTEDLTTLRYLNESSILHILRQRYGSNLIHSYAGPTMVIINPMTPLSIYSEKVVHMFRGCKQEDMPPHIYAVAQHAHRELLSNRIDQSILLLGRSGSGKTTNARHLLQYLILASGSVNNYLTVDKLNAMEMLLESFGNSRTLLNTNATRFTQLITLDFDFSGQISSATIQTLMLEKSRLVRRPEGEPNFLIFYYMLTGVDSQLRNELQLTCLTDPNQFMTPLQKNDDRQKAAQSWAKVNNAMGILGFSDEEMKAIFYVLAAIYHLGAAGTTKGNNNKSQFAKPAAAQKAASLLGIKVEELSRMIFSPSTGSGGTLTRSASMRISNAADRQAGETSTSAFDALEGFVTGLYAELFSVVVALINRALTTNYRNLGSITILDAPGFQNPSSCGRQTGSTFEDLCCNYIQERLQLFFHDATFTLQQDRYSQESIECDFEFVNTSPAAMVSLIDRPPQQTLLRSSNPDLRDSDKKGLLWMLDDEAIFPGATEDSFMERLFTQHGDHPVRRDSLLRKGSLGHTFILNHFQGTSPVQYNATGWLKVCRENAVSKIAIHILQDSSRNNISELFTTMRGPVSTTVSGSIVGEKPTSSLRRAASMRRTFTSGGASIKRKSICLQIKLQVDTLIETLRRTKCHFVHCILPQANAGLCEVKTSHSNSSNAETNLLNVPLVRSQLRGSETLEAIRIFRLGFPDFLQFTEFKHRFEVLAPPGPKTDSMDERQAMKQFIDHMDIDKLNYRIGLSQVFFRAGALTGLEVTRDEKITGTIVKFQAYCRGYLGRKKLEKLRLQHTAISCIQNNVKKFMLIRDWPWWRLYVRVKPLLNVHRTEEELKNKEAELEQLKVKFEKVERERNEYKQHCDKLDNRLSELNADLAEEATTSSHASELLDQETAERMHLEKELKEIQSKYNKAKQQNEKLEREVMQYRLWQATTFEGENEDDDIDESVYKDRYERTRKELGFLKQQLQHQHEEELQQEQNSKKHVEKKYHDSIQDCEDLRHLLSASKKKATKLNSEMQDIKRHLNEQTSRNNELERKQRKFDSELNMALQESKEERNHREKLHREKDELMALKYSLEQQNMKLKMDNEFNIEKIERLERDLNDLTESGGKDDKESEELTPEEEKWEYLALKRAKQELATKVAEQEEELDDQAGQIQQLEQSKLRLEMNIQNLRQQNMKELEEKEEELEDMRYSTQKKLKQLEIQLEEEYDDKRLLMQDKRELERQVQEFTIRNTEQNNDNEKRLKKDLRRTKALLRDAETVIQKQQSSENSKATIRQLRNQLEDAQFTAASAVKAKKNLEIELEDLQQQMEEMSKGKQDAETRYMTVLRELTDIQTRLEETEEDMNEVMAKYTAAVKQRSLDQLTMSEQLRQIEELENERDKLKYEVTDLASKVQIVEEQSVNKLQAARLETKVRDLESKLELETSTRHRFESTVGRNKEQMEKLMEERDNFGTAKHQAEEAAKKLQRQMRDLREEATDYQKRELETNHKKQELESRLTDLEIDYDQSQSDLKLAFKRISGLQAALEENIESEEDSYLSYSDEGDSDDDFGVGPEDTFLADHKQISSLYGSTGTRSRSISAASLEQDTDGLDEGSGSHTYQSASSDA